MSGNYMKLDEVYSHGRNERVPVASLDTAVDHWHRILTRLAGGP